MEGFNESKLSKSVRFDEDKLLKGWSVLSYEIWFVGVSRIGGNWLSFVKLDLFNVEVGKEYLSKLYWIQFLRK